MSIIYGLSRHWSNSPSLGLQKIIMHTSTLCNAVVPEILEPSTVSVIITPDVAGGEPSATTAQVGQTILVLEGFDVLIDCPIERGYPKPEVSWIKDGNHLSNDSTHTVFSNRSLLLRDVNTEDHEGDYTCLAMTPNVGRDNVTTSLDVIGTSPLSLIITTQDLIINTRKLAFWKIHNTDDLH